VSVIVDAQHGAVTPVRVLTHLPVVLGSMLARLVWRRWSKPAPDPTHTTAGKEDNRPAAQSITPNMMAMPAAIIA
jgi:predicted anti-sigma-YlaC factor YlaD